MKIKINLAISFLKFNKFKFKKYLVSFCLITLVALLKSADVKAKSKIITVIGLNSYTKSQNFSDFFYETYAFIDFCEQRGELHNCSLFMNDDLKLFTRTNFNDPRNPYQQLSEEPFQELVNNLKKKIDQLKSKDPNAIMRPEKTEILSNLENSLLAAKPGDQVILSLIGHGMPGLMNTSCFSIQSNHFFSSNFICTEDLNTILGRSLMPGVNVFIHSTACFSGGLQSLARPGVIVYSSADRDSVSVGSASFIGKTGLWYNILSETKNLEGKYQSLTLNDVVKKFHKIGNGALGLSSGFTTDYLKKVRCGPRNQDRENVEKIVMAPIWFEKELAYSKSTKEQIFSRKFDPIKINLLALDSRISIETLESFTSDPKYQQSIDELMKYYKCHSNEKFKSACSLLEELKCASKSEDLMPVLKKLNPELCFGPYYINSFYNTASWLTIKSYFTNQYDFFKVTQFSEQPVNFVQDQLELILSEISL